MTKEEMINEITQMNIPRCFILVTFHDEENTLFFQYFGKQDFKKFVDWNFNEFKIESVLDIERSQINSNCVIVTIKRSSL